MQVPVSEAKARLTDLVRRAEEGDDVVLTRHGQPAVRLVPVVKKRLAKNEFDALVARLQEEASRKLTPGPCAARSADFLYGDDGLPA